MKDRLIYKGYIFVKLSEYSPKVDYFSSYHQTKRPISKNSGKVLENIDGRLCEVVNAKAFSEEHGVDERSVASLLSGGKNKYRVGFWYRRNSPELLRDRQFFGKVLLSPTNEKLPVIDIFKQMGFKHFCKKRGIPVWELLREVIMGSREEYKGYKLWQE